METAPLWIGIDVAKAQLDIAIGAEGETLSVANDDAGIATLLEDLRGRNCGLVVLEATGGFEIPAVSAIAAAGIPVVVANPRQVRDFARATGQLAKTDRLDARILALFAERVRPDVRALPGGDRPSARSASEHDLAGAASQLAPASELVPAIQRRRDDARPQAAIPQEPAFHRDRVRARAFVSRAPVESGADRWAASRRATAADQS